MKIISMIAAAIVITSFAFGQAPPILRNRMTTNSDTVVTQTVATLSRNEVQSQLILSNASFVGSRDGLGSNATFYALNLRSNLFIRDASGNLNIRVWSDANHTYWSNVISGTTMMDMDQDNGILNLPIGFRFATGASAGRIGTSDANGLFSWGAAPYTQFSGGSLAIEDFSTYTAGTFISLSGGAGFSANGMITASNQVLPITWLDGVSRNVLQFNGRGDLVRPFPWGTNWQKIRIGLLLAMTNTGGLQTNSIFIGIGSQTNSGYYNAGNSNIFGVGNDGSSANFQYSNSLTFPYFGFMSLRGIHRTNTTTANNLSVTGSTGDGIAITPHWSEILIDFTRGDYLTNQLISFALRVPSRLAPVDSSVPAVLDAYPSMAQVVYDVLTETTSGLQLVDTSAATISGQNTGERFFGKLDSFTMGWGYSTNLIRIAGYVVRKIQ